MTPQRASQPPVGLPSLEEDKDGVADLRVTLRLEDDHGWTFDLSKTPGSAELRREICRAMLAWSSTSEGVRRKSTAVSKHLSISIFLRWLAKREVAAPGDGAQSAKELTSFHLVMFREYLLTGFGAHSFNSYYGDTCRLMEFLPVSEAVVWQARKRRSLDAGPVQRLPRYTQSDFGAIRKAARTVVRNAHRRITASYAEARVGASGEGTARQTALYEILTFGEPRDRAGWRAAGCWIKNHGNRTAAHLLLFPDRDEILAAAALIACKRGLNLSVIKSLSVPQELGHGLIQSNADKPRRGPIARFWPEIVGESDEERGAAAIFRMIAEMTAPLREHFSTIGEPTERLLCHWGRSPKPHPSFVTSGTPVWQPLGEPLNFGRLRRSVAVGGVGREPTHHHSSTHLHYIRTDSEALLEQQQRASFGVEAALARARDELVVQQVQDEQAPRQNDALIASCTDPHHHPTTGLPCTAGFFSFLDCLSCPNAVSVTRLLPRQMAALGILERLSDVAGDGWSDSYLHRILLLRALIERATRSEREAALEHVDQYRPLIIAALRSEIPPQHEHLFI